MKKINSKLFKNNTIARNKMAKVVGGDPFPTRWGEFLDTAGTRDGEHHADEIMIHLPEMP